MSHDILEQLQSIDSRMLTEVVRQDQRNPTFDIGEWQVERLSSKGMANSDALFRFWGSGYSQQQAKPWSIVLKILRKPDGAQDSRDIWYWKREFLVAQHGLLAQLPVGLIAPRIYATIEHPDSGWLWMEHIISTTNQPWTLAQYAYAAQALGRFNAAVLSGPPQPTYPWLCIEHCHWYLVSIADLVEQAWENGFVRAAFSETLQHRVKQLWAEKDSFLLALKQAPQVFSHFDTHRRNLFIRQRDDQPEELVAIDWAFMGYGALGGDLATLVGVSPLLFEVEPEDVLTLEALAVDAYMRGLRESGWMGEADLVRLGYTAWLALWIGLSAPAVTAATADSASDKVAWLMEQFGRGPEAAAAGWASLCAWALDRGDEARQLMARLRLG